MITLNPSVKYNNPTKYSPSKYCPSFGMVPSAGSSVSSLGQSQAGNSEQDSSTLSQSNIFTAIKHRLTQAFEYLLPEEVLKYSGSEESKLLAKEYDAAISEAIGVSRYWVV